MLYKNLLALHIYLNYIIVSASYNSGNQAGLLDIECFESGLCELPLNITRKEGTKIWSLTYAPQQTICPSGSLIRDANDALCDSERYYIHNKSSSVKDALLQLLERHRIPDFDYMKFVNSSKKTARISLALSGGGYRSMLTGAGVLEAYDERTPSSRWQLGGLYQAITYFGGVSGGSWLVMSNFVNDNEPVHKLKTDSNTWSLNEKILEGIPNFQFRSDKPSLEYFSSSQRDPIADAPFKMKNEPIFVTMMKSLLRKNRFQDKSEPESSLSWKDIFGFYKELHIEIRGKRKAGFYLSLTDYWGRALSRKIFTRSARVPGVTLSRATNLASFKNYEQPFPVICSLEKPTTSTISNKESNLFEFTPFEFGSWDSLLNAFIPVKYLGTALFDGFSLNKEKKRGISICITDFDNVGFITATSSSLFNHVFLYLYDLLTQTKSNISEAWQKILEPFGLRSSSGSLMSPGLHPDYAIYSPNPFYGYSKSRSRVTKSPHLYLVDGGEDGQNIPFHPFFRRAREVDIIFSFDMSSDILNYPNGSVLAKAAKRFDFTGSYFSVPSENRFLPNESNTKIRRSVFPEVPSVSEILSQGLNKGPLFLGCEITDYPLLKRIQANSSSKETKETDYEEEYLPPLIVYTANTEISYPSNRSTFQISYSKEEVEAMMRNGYNLATYSNSTRYMMCINCAILKREFDRKVLFQESDNHFMIPTACENCYRDFCWHSN